jgi:hypothetical protein
MNLETSIIRNRHPEIGSGSMGYRKREMLKKFQHDRDMVTVLSIGYGLWRLGASEKEGRSCRTYFTGDLGWLVLGGQGSGMRGGCRNRLD